MHTQDTSKDSNPLYAQRLEVTPLFGRGYVAGVDMREQRKHNRYLEALTLRRQVRRDLSLSPHPCLAAPH